MNTNTTSTTNLFFTQLASGAESSGLAPEGSLIGREPVVEGGHVVAETIVVPAWCIETNGASFYNAEKALEKFQSLEHFAYLTVGGAAGDQSVTVRLQGRTFDTNRDAVAVTWTDDEGEDETVVFSVSDWRRAISLALG